MWILKLVLTTPLCYEKPSGHHSRVEVNRILYSERVDSPETWTWPVSRCTPTASWPSPLRQVEEAEESRSPGWETGGKTRPPSAAAHRGTLWWSESILQRSDKMERWSDYWPLVTNCRLCDNVEEALIQHKHGFTYAWVNDVPLLDFSFSYGSMICTRHFDHPGRTHDRDWVFSQISKNLLLLTKDRDLVHTKKMKAFKDKRAGSWATKFGCSGIKMISGAVSSIAEIRNAWQRSLAATS